MGETPAIELTRLSKRTCSPRSSAPSSPRRRELCERLDLSDRDLRRPALGYSRGMEQELGLVQALQHEPRLVVLDEPTEGLDALVQETFFALMAEAAGAGRTVPPSSHVLPLGPVGPSPGRSVRPPGAAPWGTSPGGGRAEEWDTGAELPRAGAER